MKWAKRSEGAYCLVVGHFEFPQGLRDMAGSGGMWQD